MKTSELFIKNILSRIWEMKWLPFSIDIFRDRRRSATRKARRRRHAKWRNVGILASRRYWRAGPFKALFNDIEQFPVLLHLLEILCADDFKSQHLNGAKRSRRKLREAISYLREDNIQATSLALRQLNERELRPETKVFCSIAEILICLIQKETLRAVEIINGSDFSPKDLSVVGHPFLSIAQYFSAFQLNSLAEKEMAGQAARSPAARSCQGQNLLICIEGNVDPEFVDSIIDTNFIDAHRVVLCFITRRGDILDRYRHYFQNSRGCVVDVYDLPVDLAGTYSDASSTAVEHAFQISEEITRYIIENASGTTRDHALYFHDAIALYLEDHYFASLRRIIALQQLLEKDHIDVGLIISTNHLHSAGIAALILRRLGSFNTYYLNARETLNSFSLANRVINYLLKQQKMAAKERPHIIPRSIQFGSANISKADFFSYVFGPIRLPSGSSSDDRLNKAYKLLDDLSQSACALRRAYGDRLLETQLPPPHIGTTPKIYGNQTTTIDNEPWLCLVFRSDDPIARTAYEEILSIYAQNRKLLLIDLAATENAEYGAFENSILRQARLAHVWSIKDIANPQKCKAPIQAQLSEIISRGTFHIAHEGTLKKQLIGLDEEILQRILKPMDSRVAAEYLPNIFNMIGNCIYIFQNYPVDCVVCTPTRNARMRAVVQCARLWGIPSVEPQVVLNGRLIRQRAPNTDFTAVLETWSRELYINFFKYPNDRIVLGGSIRYDRIHQSLSTPAAVEAIATLRETLFPGRKVKYLILFGSQPTELEERLEGFRSLLECCSKIEEAFVVVKLHPRESKSNKQAYLQVIREAFPSERAKVVHNMDTYHLIMAADLVVAQTSNILLEAGFLDKRALSIDFGDSSRAIDFEEMGVAISAKEPMAIAEKLPELLQSNLGEHPLDMVRQDFIRRNPQLLSVSYSHTLQSLINKAINTPIPDVECDQERLIKHLMQPPSVH